MELSDYEIQIIREWLNEFMVPNVNEGDKWNIQPPENELLIKLGVKKEGGELDNETKKAKTDHS